MKVFISWSGEKSQKVALALDAWLPFVINNVKPFVSAQDIDPGVRWQTEIAEQLKDTNYGIVCVTGDNQSARWLNFEAGALAKAVESSRVIPLAVDLKPSDIEPPLGHFQAQEATEAGLHAIVRSINAACEPRLEDAKLDTAFDMWWPKLADELRAIEEATPAPAGNTRTERELLEETLDVVRGLARTASESSLWSDGLRRYAWSGPRRMIPVSGPGTRIAMFDPDTRTVYDPDTLASILAEQRVTGAPTEVAGEVSSQDDDLGDAREGDK
jgi:hypothetical protein